MSTTNRWKVYYRSAKSNGKPFPYQQDEITYQWLTPVGLWSDDQTRAATYPDYLAAKRDAKRYGGQPGKFSTGGTL